MKITNEQLVKIQTILSKKFRDRDEKLYFLSEFFGIEINSTKDLTLVQASEVIMYLNGQKSSDFTYYGRFNKYNLQHTKVLSICYVMGWVDKQKPHIVDLNRLGSWLISKYSPVNKPLFQMDAKELGKVIKALNNIMSYENKKK